MKKTRFTESQIVGILKQYDAGKTSEAICREHKVSKATFYNWRKKYNGMDTQQLRKLKELEDENKRLKRMFADLSLDHQLLKEVLEKKF
jgi:putative transposase